MQTQHVQNNIKFNRNTCERHELKKVQNINIVYQHRYKSVYLVNNVIQSTLLNS